MSKKLKITAPITNSDESVTLNVEDIATKNYVSANPASVTATLTSITINGTSYGINGGYTIDTTTGSESISNGTNTLNVMTRDTPQTITGHKIFDNSSGISIHDGNETANLYVVDNADTGGVLHITGVDYLSAHNISFGAGSVRASTLISAPQFGDEMENIDLGIYFNLFSINTIKNDIKSTYGVIIPDTSEYISDQTLATIEDIPTYYRHTIRLVFDSDIDQISYSFYFTYISSSGTTLAQNDLAGLVAQLSKFNRCVSYYQVGASSLNYGAIITDLTTTSISFVDLTSGSPANMKTVDIHSNIQVNDTAIAL